jgi:t-SNARE complex subunit (syntaxin)
MGTLTSHDYDVADAQEWCAYLDRITRECRRLILEGRMPDSEGVDAFLSDLAYVLRNVRQDIMTAASRGEATVRSRIELTHEEHKRVVTMSESVLNLLQILEMRGAVVLERTEAVSRVAKALVTGDYEG